MAQLVRVHADLSSLDGPADVPLTDMGDGTYALETRLAVGGTLTVDGVPFFTRGTARPGERFAGFVARIRNLGPVAPWEPPLPDAVTIGSRLSVSTSITAPPYPRSHELDGAEIDLSRWGGPKRVPLNPR
jgi:hypothetical protein